MSRIDRRGARAALAFALVAALGGCAAATSTPSAPTSGPSAPTSPTATPTETPPVTPAPGTVRPPATASPSATPAPTPLAWAAGRTPPMAGTAAAPLVAIAVGPAGAVAVGERAFLDPSIPAGGIATAFRSADLVAWTPAAIDDGLRLGADIPMSGPIAGMSAVAAGASGFVATGIDLTPSVTGVAWWSADGAHWTRAALPGAATARPSAVTWNGSRYVAVGIVEAARAPRMAVWTSSDGRAWHRVPDAAAFGVGGYIDTLEYHAWAGPIDVTAAGDGSLVAFGRTCTAGRGWKGEVVCSAVVWRSPDGLSWDRSTQSKALLGMVYAGAVLGPRAVLVGASTDKFGNLGGGQILLAPANAASTEPWRAIAVRDAPPLADVAVLGGTLYAVGYEITGRDDPDGTTVSLWSSADGAAWSRVAGLQALPADVVSIRGAAFATAGDRLVILVSVEIDGEPPFAGIVLAGAP